MFNPSKKFLIMFLGSFLILASPLVSKALVTARLTYGALASKDAAAKACEGTSCAGLTPEIVPLYGLGGDLLVKLPLVPFGFGLRYEKLGLDASSNGTSVNANFNRTALLVNYRFIDTIIHFGVIGSYGISHDGSVTVRNAGSNVVDYQNDKTTSYSAGLELEVKPLIVLPLIVGGELGYQYSNWKNSSDSVSGSRKDLDFSGTYLKVFAGLDF